MWLFCGTIVVGWCCHSGGWLGWPPWCHQCCKPLQLTVTSKAGLDWSCYTALYCLLFYFPDNCGVHFILLPHLAALERIVNLLTLELLNFYGWCNSACWVQVRSPVVCGVASLGYDHMELLGMFSALMYLEFIRTPKVSEELQQWKGMFLAVSLYFSRTTSTDCLHGQICQNFSLFLGEWRLQKQLGL